MTKIDDMEFHLDKIESFVNDIKYKLQSKQSERVLSSHVWMSDSIEKTINNSRGRESRTRILPIS